MSENYFTRRERVKNLKNGKRGMVVGFSRCTDEIFVLYDNDTAAVFETPGNIEKIFDEEDEK